MAVKPQRLLLVETRPGRNAHEGHAAIGISAHSPQIYGAGSLLANGARLREIFTDYVVLERDGQTARLYLMGRQSGAAAQNPALLSVGGAAAPTAAQADSHDTLADVIRAAPAFDGDDFKGLLVYANERSTAFSRLGLQDGDLITRIDGSNPADQVSALADLRPLSEGRALVVTVQRAGRTETLSLDGSLLL